MSNTAKEVKMMTSLKTVKLAATLLVTAGMGLSSVTVSAQTFGGQDTREPYWDAERSHAKAKEAAKKAQAEEAGVVAPGYIVVDQRARDGYTSIQQAVNDVAWGGVVVVLPGEYRENLSINKPVSIQGNQGPAPIRVVPTDASKPCVEVNPYRDTEHALISNITFDTSQMHSTGDKLKRKNGAIRSAVPACIAVKAGVFTMKESVVDGGGYHSGSMVAITGGMAVLEKNTIKGGSSGILVKQSHALWDRTMLVDNIITENSNVGIHLDGISSTLATGNLIKNNGSGLSYNGSGETMLVGNKILNNHGNGVTLQENAKQILMRLNQIWSNGANGVEVANNRSNGLIEFNHINGNKQDIFQVNSSSNDLRVENTIKKTINKNRF